VGGQVGVGDDRFDGAQGIEILPAGVEKDLRVGRVGFVLTVTDVMGIEQQIVGQEGIEQGQVLAVERRPEPVDLFDSVVLRSEPFRGGGMQVAAGDGRPLTGAVVVDPQWNIAGGVVDGGKATVSGGDERYKRLDGLKLFGAVLEMGCQGLRDLQGNFIRRVLGRGSRWGISTSGAGPWGVSVEPSGAGTWEVCTETSGAGIWDISVETSVAKDVCRVAQQKRLKDKLTTAVTRMNPRLGRMKDTAGEGSMVADKKRGTWDRENLIMNASLVPLNMGNCKEKSETAARFLSSAGHPAAASGRAAAG
jgi:hypothetical protein